MVDELLEYYYYNVGICDDIDEKKVLEKQTVNELRTLFEVPLKYKRKEDIIKFILELD